MTYCNAPRFPEPRDFDDDVWRIFGTYELGPVVLLKARPYDEIVDFDDIDQETHWIEYDIEHLKNSEPEIERVRVYTVDRKGKRIPVQVDGSYESCAEDYLRDSHSRWNAMKEWLQEHGERERRKEAA